jgi:hypothetical protein
MLLDDGAVLLRSILWTLFIVCVFCNHSVSRDGSSLEKLWLQNIETMDKVQRIDRIYTRLPYLGLVDQSVPAPYLIPRR